MASPRVRRVRKAAAEASEPSKRQRRVRRKNGRKRSSDDEEDDDDEDDEEEDEGAEEEDDDDEPGLCEICKVNEKDELSLICDSCDKVYHTYCLNPPLKEIPPGDWVCPTCVKVKEENAINDAVQERRSGDATGQRGTMAASFPTQNYQQPMPNRLPLPTYMPLAPNQPPPPGYPAPSAMHSTLRPSPHHQQHLTSYMTPPQSLPRHTSPMHSYSHHPQLHPLETATNASSYGKPTPLTTPAYAEPTPPPGNTSYSNGDRTQSRDVADLTEKNELLRRENQKLIEWVDRLTRRVDELSSVEETLRATQFKYRKMESQLLDLQAQLAMSAAPSAAPTKARQPTFQRTPLSYMHPEPSSGFNSARVYAPPPQELPRPMYPPPDEPPASVQQPPAPPPRPAKSSSGRYFPKGYGQPYEQSKPPQPSQPQPQTTYAQHSSSNRHQQVGHHVAALPPPPSSHRASGPMNYRPGAPFEFPKHNMPFPPRTQVEARPMITPPPSLAPLTTRASVQEETLPHTHALKGPMPVQTPPRSYRPYGDAPMSSAPTDEVKIKPDVEMTETNSNGKERAWTESSVYQRSQEADSDAADVLTSIRQSDRPVPRLSLTPRSQCADLSDIKKIGVYTPRSRRLLLERYHLKRAKRLTRQKWFKYPVRKTLADSRPRVKGRFVKNDELDESPSQSPPTEDAYETKPPIVVPTDFDYIQAFANCVKDTQSSVEEVVADIVSQKQRQGELIAWDTWTMDLEHSLISLLPKEYVSSPFPAIFAELLYILGDAEEESSQPNYCKALQAAAIYVAICLSLYTSLDPPNVYANEDDLSPIVRYYLASIEEMYRLAPKVERCHTFAFMKSIVDGIAGVICTGFENGKRYLRPVSIPSILNSNSPEDN